MERLSYEHYLSECHSAKCRDISKWSLTIHCCHYCFISISTILSFLFNKFYKTYFLRVFLFPNPILSHHGLHAEADQGYIIQSTCQPILSIIHAKPLILNLSNSTIIAKEL
jgi:hypothetical protein